MASARNFLVTKNNPECIPAEYLENMYKATKATYLCGQVEKGKEGTVHLQFFLNFKSKARPSAITKVDKHLHIEVVKVNNGADDYCLKEETRIDGPWEFGVKPVKRSSKKDWERVFTLAKQGNFDEIPADIKVQHYGNLQRIRKDNLVFKDSEDVRGVWIWGKAGVGKSRKAREDFPNFYPKLCNKWFDGYQGEEHVIMDDLDPERAKMLAQNIKLWTDRYGVVLETKGGALADNYKAFVVTS